MNDKKIKQKANEFLTEPTCEGGLSKFAQKLGIKVYFQDIDPDAMAIMAKSGKKKVITLNKNKLTYPQELKFVLAYQLAEYIIRLSDEKEFVSFFTIDSLDFEIYELAKQLYTKSFEVDEINDISLSNELRKELSVKQFTKSRK